MSQLSYVIQKNASVYGLPKVYFCSHPMDFDAYFEDISYDIRSKQNCSIWHHGNKPVKYNDEFFEDLSQMQLFVIPVTSRFLQPDCTALTVEFRYAVDHHIPILPLMQEQGLEAAFNRLCGSIQYLDKHTNDTTSIEYGQKLETFLSAVLLGDELTRKIQDAFDAYIFLSYRKVDRHHAQELMKLIHQNEFCRDIAIWYDEFLVPGDDFNDAISVAITKSDLFLLTVTPNIINEDNYIMNVEFPMAQEQNKPILPCVMSDTNQSLLSKKFEGIPPCANGQNPIELEQRLRHHFRKIATAPRNSSPEHLYFIGLAYLNGIDVEVDRSHGLKLITAAAEKKLPEAVEQLVNMYASGIGVKIDNDKALYWRKQLVDIAKSAYEQDINFPTALNYFQAQISLAQLEFDLDLFDEAMVCCDALEVICNSVSEDLTCTLMETLELQRFKALANLLRGRIYHAYNNFPLAKIYFEKVRGVFEKFDIFDAPQLRYETALLFSVVAQLCKVEADYDGALFYYEKAAQLLERNSRQSSQEEHQFEYAMTLMCISEIKRCLWDCSGAMQSSLKALEILDDLIRARNSVQYFGSKMLVLLDLAESYRVNGDLDKAFQTYDTLERLEELCTQQYGDVSIGVRVRRLLKTAQIYFMLGDYEPVIRFGTQALEMIGQTAFLHDSYLATGGTEDMVLNFYVGAAYFNARNDLNRALQYLKPSANTADRMVYRGIQCNIPDVIMVYSTYGDFLQMNGQIEAASIYLKKAVSLYEEHLSKDETLRNISSGFTLYIALGKNHIANELADDALILLNKAASLYPQIVAQLPDGENLLFRDYAILNYHLAECYMERDSSQAREYYLRCMDIYQQVPEEKYIIADWNLLGVTAYQLYCLSGRIVKAKLWKQRLLDVAHKIKTLFPEQYRYTFFYEALNDTGIFD